MVYNQFGPMLSRLYQLDVTLPRHISVNNGAQLVWPIDGWSEKLAKARTGHNTIVYSRPFETTPHGYQLIAAVAPNGDGKGIGR